MAYLLRQSTASQEVPLGYFLDSTNGDSEETSLTIANTDIKLHKTGATTLANKNSGGGTHISNGIYYAVLDATDTNTLGPMVIFVHVSGSLAVRLECLVLSAAVYDAIVAGTGAGVRSEVITMATGVLTGTAVAASAVTKIWDEVIEGTDTARGFLRGLLSAVALKLAGAATATITTRDMADTKNRLTLTTDASGNRTAVSKDFS